MSYEPLSAWIARQEWTDAMKADAVALAARRDAANLNPLTLTQWRIWSLSYDQVPAGVLPEHWHAAAVDASLGVGHVWTAVSCPAYRTLDGADCTCGKV